MSSRVIHCVAYDARVHEGLTAERCRKCGCMICHNINCTRAHYAEHRRETTPSVRRVKRELVFGSDRD